MKSSFGDFAVANFTVFRAANLKQIESDWQRLSDAGILDMTDAEQVSKALKALEEESSQKDEILASSSSSSTFLEDDDDDDNEIVLHEKKTKKKKRKRKRKSRVQRSTRADDDDNDDDDGDVESLHELLIQGNVGKVLASIDQQRSDTSVRDQAGQTLLHVASLLGDERVVAKLLEVDGNRDVNARDAKGYAPLHLARSVAVATQLVAGGADVNAQNDQGNTPAHRAYYSKNTDVLAYLVDAAAADQSLSNARGRILGDVVRARLARYRAKHQKEDKEGDEEKEETSDIEIQVTPVAAVAATSSNADVAAKRRLQRMASTHKLAGGTQEASPAMEGTVYRYRKMWGFEPMYAELWRNTLCLWPASVADQRCSANCSAVYVLDGSCTLARQPQGWRSRDFAFKVKCERSAEQSWLLALAVDGEDDAELQRWLHALAKECRGGVRQRESLMALYSSHASDVGMELARSVKERRSLAGEKRSLRTDMADLEQKLEAARDELGAERRAHAATRDDLESRALAAERRVEERRGEMKLDMAQLRDELAARDESVRSLEVQNRALLADVEPLRTRESDRAEQLASVRAVLADIKADVEKRDDLERQLDVATASAKAAHEARDRLAERVAELEAEVRVAAINQKAAQQQQQQPSPLNSPTLGARLRPNRALMSSSFGGDGSFGRAFGSSTGPPRLTASEHAMVKAKVAATAASDGAGDNSLAGSADGEAAMLTELSHLSFELLAVTRADELLDRWIELRGQIVGQSLPGLRDALLVGLVSSRMQQLWVDNKETRTLDELYALRDRCRAIDSVVANEPLVRSLLFTIGSEILRREVALIGQLSMAELQAQRKRWKEKGDRSVLETLVPIVERHLFDSFYMRLVDADLAELENGVALVADAREFSADVDQDGRCFWPIIESLLEHRLERVRALQPPPAPEPPTVVEASSSSTTTSTECKPVRRPDALLDSIRAGAEHMQERKLRAMMPNRDALKLSSLSLKMARKRSLQSAAAMAVVKVSLIKMNVLAELIEADAVNRRLLVRGHMEARDDDFTSASDDDDWWSDEDRVDDDSERNDPLVRLWHRVEPLANELGVFDFYEFDVTDTYIAYRCHTSNGVDEGIVVLSVDANEPLHLCVVSLCTSTPELRPAVVRELVRQCGKVCVLCAEEHEANNDDGDDDKFSWTLSALVPASSKESLGQCVYERCGFKLDRNSSKDATALRYRLDITESRPTLSFIDRLALAFLVRRR
jgi:Ankyrin repeats (3 copies)